MNKLILSGTLLSLLAFSGCASNQVSQSTPAPSPSVSPDITNTQESTPPVTQPPTTNSASNNSNSSQTKKTITIQNFSFSPATITINKGDTITWTNNDSAPHQIASDSSDLPTLSSSPLSNGQAFTFTFDKTGTFSYHCAIHPTMKGTIVVK